MSGAPVTKNMVRLPGGRYLAGDDRFYPEEAPVIELDVDALWVDEHPVTNAEFRRFVKETGHVTVAEIAPSAEQFPDAAPDQLQPGSLVFQPSTGPVPLDDWTRWWRWVPGADWRHPSGPGSTLHGLERHPVVHVGFEDAAAYAAWAGKELPTEAQWEYAARGGRERATYAWGEEFMPRGRVMANTWHGRFPWENLAPHGFAGTSPVGRFPPNGFGLFDVTGNVWEWTSSTWTDGRADHPLEQAPPVVVHSCCAPSAPLAEDDRRVTKGGSHLCAPSYCLRYRPAARQGHAVRSSTGHVGFRCVLAQSG
jgi:formylglycine-generating enzyme required for sulfatase activity